MNFTTLPTTADTTAPTLTAGPSSSVDDHNATISWSTNESSDSFVEYGATNSYGKMEGSDQLTTSHSYTLQNLTPGTSYHFRIKSKDSSGNPLVGGDLTFTTLADQHPVDTTPPTITSTPTVVATDTSATISWNTNENSDSYVEIGTEADKYGHVEGADGSISAHSYTIENLLPVTTYHIRTRSRDAAGNQGTSDDVSFTTLVKQDVTDHTPPEISVVNNNLVDGKVNITWTTNEDSDSIVQFGKTTNYSSVQGNIESTQKHTVVLIGLDTNTVYYYRIKSSDSSSNVSYSEDKTFTTVTDTSGDSNPNITGATAQKPGANPEEVTIIWTTDKYATSQVLYGETEDVTQQTAEDKTLNKTHYILIDKLKPRTKYYYRVRSVDDGGHIVLGDEKYFVTSQSDNETPAISAVEVSNITLNSAIISWETNVITSSVVEYGTDNTYGNRIQDMSAGSTTKHTVILKDLQSGIKYHYRVVGDTPDNISIIANVDSTFDTLTIPVISNISVKDISSSGSTVTWTTNTATDSYIDFGESSTDQSQGRSDLVSDHAITLVGLKPAVKYSYKIKSRDQYSNQAISDIQSFSTIVDTIPPQIQDLKSETSVVTDANGNSTAQIIVSWSTDESATSQVKYAMGSVSNNDYPSSTAYDKNLTTSHVVIIPGLQPSATYHLMIVTADSSNNVATSGDYTVLTQQQNTSLVQYIVQVLQERFSFLKSFGLFN
jgi:phosphodiesterase/alkaline phosphatase D-like protein